MTQQLTTPFICESFEEEWHSVVGYEGLYEVSTAGHVKRVKACRGTRVGLLLKATPDKYGYPTVELSGGVLAKDGRRRKRLYVHTLIARAFLGDIPEGCEVNHKDGVKAHCHLHNLEIGTRQHNVDHAWATGLVNNAGSRSHFAKLDDATVAEIRRIYDSGECCNFTQLSRRFQVSQQTVSRLIRRLTWRRG